MRGDELTRELFSGPFVSQLFDAKESRLRETVVQLSEQALAEAAEDALAEEVAAKFRLKSITIDEDSIESSTSETQIDPRRRPSQYSVDQYTPRTVPGIRIQFFVPFTGDSQLFEYHPERGPLDYPQADIVERELVFTYEGPASEAEKISDDFRRRLKNVVANAAGTESSVVQFNDSLKEKALSAIKTRREQHKRTREAGERTGFPSR